MRAALLWLALLLPACAVPPVGAAGDADCAGCFAVFVMPDTQYYTSRRPYEDGARHLRLMTGYACDHRPGARLFREPSTGKRMPVVMLVHLGDIVQNGDTARGDAMAEWKRVDAAFDRLDQCGLPYLLVPGNHDYTPVDDYAGETRGYERFFGAARHAAHACAEPLRCQGERGKWFVGSGDPIERGSRGRGPSVTHEGRHRAVLAPTPGGGRMLFLGLELAFDFGPGVSDPARDDGRFPQQVLEAYARVPTVVVHHALFLTNKRHGREEPGLRHTFQRFGAPPTRGVPYGKALWQHFVAPHPQVFMTLNGHVAHPAKQTQGYARLRPGPTPVHALVRNFQGSGEFKRAKTGSGWSVMLVFDPRAGEIRVRSYRIDDEANYRTRNAWKKQRDPEGNTVDTRHTGPALADPRKLDMDYFGIGERVIPWDFGAAARSALAATP